MSDKNRRYNQILEGLIDEYKQIVEGVYEDFESRNNINETDSPIEKILYIQLKHYMILLDEFIFDYETELVPQYKIKKDDSFIRVDFLYKMVSREDSNKTLNLVIECDGHDFHEKTKEQAQRDKSRDRFLMAQGYHVMRFTGSEIYKNPERCIREIQDFITEKLYGEEIRLLLQE